MVAMRRKLLVHVVSDATGITAERVIRQVLVQFQRHVDPTFERHAFVRSPQQLKRILDRADGRGGLLIYSLVNHRLLETIRRQTPRANLEVIDLMGPMLRRLAQVLEVPPSMEVGLRGMPGEESLRLAEAIDFTLRHDDGQGLESLGLADLVILGPSRTSKTPTSIYVSCHFNLKVANVPIMPEVEPPAKLFMLKRPAMVGFTIRPERLARIRATRYRAEDLPGYADLASVRGELAHCQRIFARVSHLRVVDVTDRPIEDIAKELL